MKKTLFAFIIIALLLKINSGVAQNWEVFSMEKAMLFSACYKIDFKAKKFVYEYGTDDNQCAHGQGTLIEQKGEYVLQFVPIDSIEGIQTVRENEEVDTLYLYIANYEEYDFPAGKVSLYKREADASKMYTLNEGMTKIPLTDLILNRYLQVDFLGNGRVVFSTESLKYLSIIRFDPTHWDEEYCKQYIITGEAVELARKGKRKIIVNWANGSGNGDVFIKVNE